VSFLEALAAEPWRFDWLATMRRLERQHPEKPRFGDSAARAQEFVALSQNPYLEFPASTIEAASKDENGRLRLVARFLGMFGPQGALPLTTTDEAYAWLRARDDAFPRFVDIFQARFLALFFRAWADARPIAQNDRPGEDRFRDYVGSVVGLGAAWFKNRDTVHDFVKLEYAGLMASRVKSVSRLRFFLTGLVGSRVEIDEFVGAWLTLDEGERSRLGDARCGLGTDAMLGASAFTVSDKFRVRVYARDFAHYEQFLPGAPMADQIADAVFAYVGDEYDWDLELAIPAGEIRAARMGLGARLGWTGWMAPNWSKADKHWRADARFHLVSRRGARAVHESGPQ
jgi:type VI secretion system protein ImpH